MVSDNFTHSIPTHFDIRHSQTRGDTKHDAFINKTGTVIREPSLKGASLLNHLAYDWWRSLERTTSRPFFCRHLIESVKISCSDPVVSSLIGHVPPVRSYDGLVRHHGYQQWFVGLSVKNPSVNDDDEAGGSFKVQVLDNSKPAKDTYAPSLLSDDYESACRLFQTFAIPVGNILYTLLPYGIRWSLQWTHPLLIDTYVRLGFPGFSEPERKGLIMDLNIVATNYANSTKLCDTLPVQVMDCGIPHALGLLLSSVASSLLGVCVKSHVEDNRLKERRHVCTPVILAVKSCRDYTTINSQKTPENALGCDFWGSAGEDDVIVTNLVILTLSKMVESCQMVNDVATADGLDSVSWLVAKLEATFSSTVSSTCGCFPHIDQTGYQILLFDENQQCDNSTILARQMELLELKSRREQCVSSSPNRFTLWNSAWYNYLTDLKLLETPIFKIMSRAVRLAICGFMCELITRMNHNTKDGVCQWNSKFVDASLSDRLKSALAHKKNPEIFENPQMKAILEIQDGIYGFLSEHSKYNKSLSSSVWSNGRQSKFNYSILSMNNMEIKFTSDDGNLKLDPPHPYSMFGKVFGVDKCVSPSVRNIAAEFFIVPDSSNELSDPQGLLQRLTMRDCNEIDNITPAINSMWDELKQSQAAEGSSSTVPGAPLIDTASNSSTTQHQAYPHAEDSSMLFPIWNHGVVISVIRDEPLFDPFHGIQVGSKSQRLSKEYCDAAWHESPNLKSQAPYAEIQRHVKDLDRSDMLKAPSDRSLVGWGSDVTQTVLLKKRYVCPLPDLKNIIGLSNPEKYNDGAVHTISQQLTSDMLNQLFPLHSASLYRLKYGYKLHHPVAHLHQSLPSISCRPVSFSFNLSILAEDIQMMEAYRLTHRLFAKQIFKDLVQVEWPNAQIIESADSVKERGQLIDGDGVRYSGGIDQFKESQSALHQNLLPPPGEWISKGPGGGPFVVVATTERSRLGECVQRALMIRKIGVPCQWRQLTVKSDGSFKKHLERFPSVLMILLLLKRGETTASLNPKSYSDKRCGSEVGGRATSLANRLIDELAKGIVATNNLQTYPVTAPFRYVVTYYHRYFWCQAPDFTRSVGLAPR
eukprot:GHVH01012878.1.p1 GENE.GHVH01012878.1~~GHVH01012878.1.p1  ORF type:complete len:1115 (-),score=129.17 GHVH01012878.1:251-3535(-)